MWNIHILVVLQLWGQTLNIKNIKIAGTQYALKFIDNLRSIESGQKISGYISHKYGYIKIDTDLAKQITNQVIIHEMVHGLEEHFNLETNEDITVKIANGIYGLIVDNADFFKELIKYDEKLKKRKN